MSEDEYSKVTIAFNSEDEAVIIPGTVKIGEDIKYGEKRATAEGRLSLPLKMDKEMLNTWIEEQMNLENSMLRNKIQRVKDGR